VRVLAVVVLSFTVVACGSAAVRVTHLADAPKCPVFPASNPWNQRVDKLPVAKGSAQYVAAIGRTERVFPDLSVPYNVVSGRQPKARVTFELGSDEVGYPIPARPKVETGTDKHILMVDKDACRLYEISGARKLADGWHAWAGATWDLRSNALRREGATSADAAGLPMLPGLLRYEDIESGAINHALRFTARKTAQSYVYPARHWASTATDPHLPPMGLRVRLKASFDTSGFPPQAKIVLEALKRYGMILADNGSPWFITGSPDPRWTGDVAQLQRVTGNDFEVVDTSSLTPGA
jgi:hypothetical protein